MKNQISKICCRPQLRIKDTIKVSASLLLVSAFFIFAVSSAFAQTGNSTNQPSQTGQSTNQPKIFTLQNPLKVDSLGGLIQAFVEVFTYLVIIFAILALVYVGLQYILARGNPERMKELSNWLLWIVVGIAIVLGARIIVSIVINTLGASGVVDPGIIQSANDALDGR